MKKEEEEQKKKKSHDRFQCNLIQIWLKFISGKFYYVQISYNLISRDIFLKGHYKVTSLSE
jgi:hypothetical protein